MRIFRPLSEFDSFKILRRFKSGAAPERRALQVLRQRPRVWPEVSIGGFGAAYVRSLTSFLLRSDRSEACGAGPVRRCESLKFDGYLVSLPL